MSLLQEALRTRLIPWSQHNAADRFIVARPKMSAAQMPDGAQLVRRKITGPRVIVKNKRFYGNVRGIKAQWPDVDLIESDQYKMICVLAGRIDFQVGHYAVQCGEGFHLIIPPGTPQPGGIGSLPAGEKFYNTFNIILHPHAVQCFILHVEAGRPVEWRENYLFKNNDLATLFQLLVDEMMRDREKSAHICADLLSAFWTILQRDVERHHYINPGPVGRPEAGRESEAGFEAELLRYIQSHLMSRLTLEDAARGMYLSRAQFVRRMRRETGKTFVQYLTDYRISEAKVLLADSDWTIAAIAGFLGFTSSTYFQAVFRRATGKSPSRYRETLRKKS
jgi:AraC-like DNA-binding protein